MGQQQIVTMITDAAVRWLMASVYGSNDRLIRWICGSV